MLMLKENEAPIFAVNGNQTFETRVSWIESRVTSVTVTWNPALQNGAFERDFELLVKWMFQKAMIMPNLCT